jgi:hypothetical protein
MAQTSRQCIPGTAGQKENNTGIVIKKGSIDKGFGKVRKEQGV